MTRYIEGIIRLVTPLHVASMSKSQKVDENGKNKNVSRTTKMPIFTDGGVAMLPYFPGNDLRGRMRRAAAKAIMDVVQPVSLPIYHALTCGSAGPSPESGKKSVKMIIESKNDLYLGLFGGGARLHRGACRVRNMVPMLPGAEELGLIPEGAIERNAISFPAEGNDGFQSVTSCYNFTRNDDLLKGQDLGAPMRIKNYADVAQAWEARLSSDKKEDDKKLGISNIMTIEAISTGVPMYLRIDFDNHATDAQIAFAARCLVDVLNGPIGGKVSGGFGVTKIQSLSLVTDGGSLNILGESDGVGNYYVSRDLPGYEAHEEALDNYSIGTLSRLLLGQDDEIDENGLLKIKEKPVSKKKAAADAAADAAQNDDGE